MLRIPLPNKLEFQPTDDHRASLVVEPLYPGYGVTIGNALRRVLLSSLGGAAVTAIKIEGVTHEFTTLPGIKEDMVDLILNIKRIRVRSFSDEPVVLKLDVKGSMVATAGDIDKDSSVEIVNPEQPIATLTDKSSKLVMELTITKGRGYVPVETREKEKLDLGVIAVDAIYTPIERVGFEVEHVRVGQMVNFDKLVMNIKTDGAVGPEEAVRQAAEILMDHFQLFASQESPETVEAVAEEPVAEIAVEETTVEAPAEAGEEEKPKRGRKPKKK
ncbi:MAG: DNA-directed RNA polymerase subunit alpha [bacterium]